MYLKTIPYLLLYALLQTSCAHRSVKPSSTEFKSSLNTTLNSCLKDKYKDYFPIGVAVEPWNLKEDEAELIKKEFSSLTAENRMKMHHLLKSDGTYNWKPADEIVKFAQKNGLLMRGHTLCWHDRVPEWFLVDSSGKVLSKDQLLARLKTHITQVVSRYKGQVYAWDVVNEAISNEDTEIIESSPFQKICGDDYIASAFMFAHEADSQAKLYYNEYGFLDKKKREKICTLIRTLKAQGVPIHGIGIQSHWSIHEPTESELREMLDEICSLGLRVHVSELDVSIFSKKAKNSLSSGVVPMTEEQEMRQAEVYEMLFNVFRDYREHIDAVTFWNVSDRHSWMDSKDRKVYPLLFDQNLRPKKAYHAVTDFQQ